MDPVAVNLTQSDLWDDSLLIKSYEDSLRLAQEQVAKRIAQSTNNKHQQSSSADEDAAGPSPSDAADPPAAFGVGDLVRCTFSEDGIDYEAEVVALIDAEQCIVKYLGYNNEETVDLSLLIPSWGKKARDSQVARATAQEPPAKSTTPHATGRRAKKTAAGKARVHTFDDHHRYPQSSSSSSMMIPPPPPLPPHFGDSSGDSEHLSAMLMAWYMSGYYTGFYQGQKSKR